MLDHEDMGKEQLIFPNDIKYYILTKSRVMRDAVPQNHSSNGQAPCPDHW